jgi:UDP-N-acetylglucosamine 1-carboxyvinyltransferase
MDKFKITGGVLLDGEISISGAKNSVLPIMAASILNSGTTILKNVPHVHDVITMKEILEHIGANVVLEDDILTINTKNISKTDAPYELVKKMRASYYVLGALIGRFGEASVSLPGGCVIGARPVNLHIKGFKALNANISLEHGYIKVLPSKLKGASVFLEGLHGSSVGATINVMMAASCAEGTTYINGAACEPEVVDVANFINSIGGEIYGTGELKISNLNPDHIGAILNKLSETGVKYKTENNSIIIAKAQSVNPVNIKVSTYPGFPTDMQAQFSILMTQAKGSSIILETIFENRFMYIPELMRMGAKIQMKENSAIINGPTKLDGAEIMASDLRASAALVLAALIAKGESTISRIYHIDRGYTKIENKLKNVGALIERIG